MNLKLFLILLSFSFVCHGQMQKKAHYQDINFKDVKEIKGLIYFKADTTLVTGKVIRYNRKNEAKSYILVTKGKPNMLGWKNTDRSNYIPPFKPLFKKSNGLTGENDLAPYDEFTRKSYNRINELKSEDKKNKNESYVKTYKDTLLKSEDTRVKTKRDGLWKEYFDNGKLMIIGYYINGKKNGTWKEYFENGQLSSVSNFVLGKKENLLELYYENGKIKGRINYKDGIEDGNVEMYHINGLLIMTGKFKEGKQVGNWNYFNEKGELINTNSFEN